jgi:cysteine synthase A
MVNDNGLRYLSTELCGAPKDLDVPDREHPTSDRDREKLEHHHLTVVR